MNNYTNTCESDVSYTKNVRFVQILPHDFGLVKQHVNNTFLNMCIYSQLDNNNFATSFLRSLCQL